MNKCQSEFEFEKVSVEDENEAREKARKRKLGNIKFIGELFRRKLLPEKIIHDCIKSLIDTIREKIKTNEVVLYESSSEVLCKLMTTVGKFIDNEKGKQYVEQYFAALKKFQGNSVAFKPRIRFMFQVCPKFF